MWASGACKLRRFESRFSCSGFLLKNLHAGVQKSIFRDIFRKPGHLVAEG